MKEQLENISDISLEQLQEGSLVESGRVTRGEEGEIIGEVPTTLTISVCVDSGDEKLGQFDRELILSEGDTPVLLAPMADVLGGHFEDWVFHKVYTPQELEDGKK